MANKVSKKYVSCLPDFESFNVPICAVMSAVKLEYCCSYESIRVVISACVVEL